MKKATKKKTPKRAAKAKRNPSKEKAPAKKNTRRNPSDLADAKKQAETFHCQPGNVIAVSEKDRKPLSKHVVVLGELESVTYGPKKSCRADALYKHAFGDRGPLLPRAHDKPLLVADPETERIAIVQRKSPAKFNDRLGIVG